MKKFFSFSLSEEGKKTFQIWKGKQSVVFTILSWGWLFLSAIVFSCALIGKWESLELAWGGILIVSVLILGMFLAFSLMSYVFARGERDNKWALEHAEQEIKAFYYSPFILPFCYLRRCLKSGLCLC